VIGERWVLDATLAGDGPPWPFCPLEGDPEGEFTVVEGLTLVTDRPPGEFVGVVHAEGQEAVEAWMEVHGDALEEVAR
jgi:hypothetical protein